jgi:hypothetical protein
VQEDGGVLVTTALDVAEGFGMFLIINATTMQVPADDDHYHAAAAADDDDDKKIL